MSQLAHQLLRWLVAAGTSVSVTGCGIASDCKDLELFSSFAQANRMRIATKHDKTIRETTDPREIATLLRFVAARKDDWCKPWFGTPIGLVRAELYADKKFLGSISLGSNFIGTGMWRVRSIEQSERQDLLRIFSVEDPYAKSGR